MVGVYLVVVIGLGGGCWLGRQTVADSTPTPPPPQVAYLTGTTTMAGSCVTLWDTFVALVTSHGLSIPDAIAMVACNPARIARLVDVGVLEAGRRGDFLLIAVGDDGGPQLRGVSVGGVLAHET